MSAYAWIPDIAVESVEKDNLNKLHRPDSRTLPTVLRTYVPQNWGSSVCIQDSQLGPRGVLHSEVPLHGQT